MDIMKSIATDHTVPFRARERQGALPILAATAPVQGITVSAAGMAVAAFGAGVRADGALNPTGDFSASFLASPL